MKERLSESIRLLSLNKTKFAKEIGVSSGNLTDWIKGRTKPTAEVLVRIHEKFNININWLLTGKGDIFVKEKKFVQPFPNERRKEFREEYMYVLYQMIIKLDLKQREKLMDIISTVFDQPIVYKHEEINLPLEKVVEKIFNEVKKE